MSDEPRVFGDRYELVRHIARGGMARVYLARDLLLDRPVALKVLFPELSVDESFVQRFRREAQAAANLAHPNIVSIYDWGQGERTYYIVMEYVDGETLSTRIRRGPLSADQAAIVGISTAAALAFAHRRQVIHRDVKPGNVLIDKSGQVKVADFGIARAVGAAEDLTQAGAVMGTATYFSPEQAQGYAVDARGDVYSLGVVLYEMVVGRPPFQGDTPVAIAYKHVRELPEPPSRLNPDVPAAYEAITLKALAKEPEHRYQSAEELRADLERFRANKPVAAMQEAALTTAMAAGATQGTRVLPAGAGAAPATGGMRRRELPPPSDEPRSRTGRYVALVVALLVILGLLLYFLGKDAGLFGGSARTLTIPKVAGEPAKTAENKLVNEGFSYVYVLHETNSSVADGTVIATKPGAGKRLKSNAKLTLVASAGAPSVRVPSVRGDTEANAEQVLKAKGFSVNVVTTPSPHVAAGDAIKTDPAAGTALAKGIKVTLVVSSGQANVAVPSLQGLSPAAAGAKLNAAGLAVGPQSYENSSTVSQGAVVATYPAAGTSVRPGTAVTLYVSNGPKKVDVPNVVGDTQDQACAALSAVDLTCSPTTVAVTSAGQNGLVQSTDPQSGTSVDAGGSVSIAVGSYSAPTTTSTSSSTSTSTTSTSTTTTTIPLLGNT